MDLSVELADALSLIRDIPDFPEPGILFRDITPLVGNGPAFAAVTQALIGSNKDFSHVVGVEARGFILGAAMAIATGKGFIPFRKAGKLPHTTIARSYGLEYGSDVIEAHIDSLTRNDCVLLIDDVLATGGTIIAALEILKELGSEVAEVIVLFEIASLGGRERIQAQFPDLAIRSLVQA